MSRQHHLLTPGDPFPALEVATAGGLLHLPGDLAGSYAAVLVYRGSWCPYCNAQLAAFQRALPDLTEAGAQVVALSVDDEATTAAFVAKRGLTFPVGFGADAAAWCRPPPAPWSIPAGASCSRPASSSTQKAGSSSASTPPARSAGCCRTTSRGWCATPGPGPPDRSSPHFHHRSVDPCTTRRPCSTCPPLDPTPRSTQREVLP